MASLVQRVTDVAARIVLTSATVGTVIEHDGFRTIELVGDKLVDEQWTPGDKIRIRTEGRALRTYTPMSWDRGLGRVRVLAYVHGSGPGSEWCATARSGAACQLLGPDHSVRLDRLEGGPIFVGDETSFGLAIAWRVFSPGAPPVASLFEVNQEAESRSTLRDHGYAGADLVVRAAGDAHVRGLAEAVLDAVRAHPDASLCITGRAQTIAAVRRHLKGAGVAPASTLVKAYWDVNRKGLD